jgi:predicted transcriptional regulator
MMQVQEAMTTSVTAVRADTPVPIAASVLASSGRSMVPVVDATGAPVGTVTAAQLGSTLDTSLDRGEIDPEAVVAAVMTHRPVTVHADDDLADVVACMLDHGLRAVPVVDDGRLVGILTRCDVLRQGAGRQLLSAHV